MNEHTIYVRLMDEGTDCWRPVRAARIDDVTYQIIKTAPPDDEMWEFQPGSTVTVAERVSSDGTYPVAVQLKK